MAKEFQDYIAEPTGREIEHDDYVESPATAFLEYTVEAKDAIKYCQDKFETKNDDSYTKDAQDSLHVLISAMLPAIMGHFETYQRYLFAGVFELSSYFEDFSPKRFFRNLEDSVDRNLDIDLVKLSAYRGMDAPVGVLLADHLSWHDPNRVNSYFKDFGLEINTFSNDQCQKLKVLWQLRHSIVHTGGTITRPDAQEIPELEGFGGDPIIFEDQFVWEVSRRMHSLVDSATGRLETETRANLDTELPEDVSDRVDQLFRVDSSVTSWLS
jgi:hypothetical protein